MTFLVFITKAKKSKNNINTNIIRTVWLDMTTLVQKL
jgi:hypothetical protein